MKNYSRIRLNGITIFIFNKNLTEEKRVYRRRKTNDSKAELVPSERQIEDEISVQIKCDTESDVKEEECEILENGQTKDNKCAKESTSDEFPLNEDEIEQVILEKLRLIDEKPKFHQEKVKELYDDIQIFAYFEKGDRKEKSRNAILSLRTHIGEHDSEELFKIIDKIAKNEMKPNLKAFKIPRSWRKAKK